MSDICVSIGRTRPSAMVGQHRKTAEAGAKLVELRLDYLGGKYNVAALLKDRPTPVIATCRRRQETGRFRGSEEERMTILRQAIVAGADYVDLESDVAADVPRFGDTKRIISHHDFRGTPENLKDLHKSLVDLDADVVKIATTAASPVDAVRMLRLVDESEVPTAAFCMGEAGVFSRILCGRYGSPFTYATFSSERVLAPGQLSFREMRDRFNYEAITRKTAVFGVIGDPIKQSYSPHIHNAALKQDGLDAVYVPVLVPAGAFRESMEALEWLRFGGFSVTIPHKGAAAEMARFKDEAVKEAGVSNTLYRDDRMRWHATNTDYTAALATLREVIGEGNTLAGKQVLILGAGGVSRAIGMGLIKAGCGVTVANRNRVRAKSLASDLGCQHVAWENRGSVLADILVNGTPVGMHPELDDTPFPGNWLREGTVVFDTIYNPENTLLLKEARERNCITASGLDMFVRQAASQYECFARRPAPLELMRQTLRQDISPFGLN